MNYLTGGCFFALLVTNYWATAASSLLPSNVIKVTNQNNPSCVDYLTYHGELYCSQTALDKNPVDPKILSYEKQNIMFDDRPWKAVWSKNSPQITTVEYVPWGDDINNWHELITTQFIPGTHSKSPSSYTDQFMAELNKAGITTTFKVFENQTNKQVIFEFKVDKPENLQQDELQKVTIGKNGMYILHYAIKKQDMGEENRQKWLGNLRKSSIKE